VVRVEDLLLARVKYVDMVNPSHSFVAPPDRVQTPRHPAAAR
jgi:hypothetical protein